MQTLSIPFTGHDLGTTMVRARSTTPSKRHAAVRRVRPTPFTGGDFGEAAVRPMRKLARAAAAAREKLADIPDLVIKDMTRSLCVSCLSRPCEDGQCVGWKV